MGYNATLKRSRPKRRTSKTIRLSRSPRRVPVFKVLRTDGTSTYGHAIWPLPKRSRPGVWVECEDTVSELRLCTNGLHLTHNPFGWFGGAYGHRMFLVEYEVPKGEIPAEGCNGKRGYIDDAKFCVYRARLLREVTVEEAKRLMRKGK